MEVTSTSKSKRMKYNDVDASDKNASVIIARISSKGLMKRD